MERLIEELQYHEIRTRELTVYLSCADANSLGATVPFGTPTDRFDLIADAAKLGLRRVWRPGAPCTRLHLIASKLVRGTKWQGNLFELPDPRHDAIARVKRAINREFGRFKLRSGATLYSNAFYADPANEHDVCDIRGKFCF